jgi:hypothetical protein
MKQFAWCRSNGTHRWSVSRVPRIPLCAWRGVVCEPGSHDDDCRVPQADGTGRPCGRECPQRGSCLGPEVSNARLPSDARASGLMFVRGIGRSWLPLSALDKRLDRSRPLAYDLTYSINARATPNGKQVPFWYLHPRATRQISVGSRIVHGGFGNRTSTIANHITFILSDLG